MNRIRFSVVVCALALFAPAFASAQQVAAPAVAPAASPDAEAARPDAEADTDAASTADANDSYSLDGDSSESTTAQAIAPAPLTERDDVIPTGDREDPSPPNATAVSEEATRSGIPIRLNLNGYYRARIFMGHNFPVERPLGADTDPSLNPSFAYMRLRLEPSITYGSDPLNPVAAARFQIDALDNVVFGDNARLSSTPLFTEQPSLTDIYGTDTQAFKLRRAWLEFNIPVGQIRIGRQGSMGGLGILFNDGNGFRNDWGDANYGTTFDRVLFATRPMTIARAIATGDTRPTPLLFAIAHDWLVEDPLGLNSVPNPTRSSFPFATLGNGADDVEETIVVLAWNNPNVNPLRSTDEFSVGTIDVYRSQQQTSSNVYIADLFWKIRYSVFGRRAPALVFNGEIMTIQGSSYGLGVGPGQVLDEAGRTPRETGAAIWGGVFQLGAAADRWAGLLEAGYASGDGNLFSRSDFRFDQRALHPDYHVGLLMYGSAIAARTANAYSGQLSALQSRGGVWNSKYLFPQFRYRLAPGVDVLGAFLLAWADQLNEAYPATIARRETAGSQRTSCKVFEGDCFLGWEADLALKVSWGENDIMRWSTEFGIMNAGGALALEMQNTMLWTLQTRIAMAF
ncbi:MAG: hypothetical protein IPK60_17635 [Sandaracinaceae bacterium]|nr:hypothetical protein [Sandaracinaceae bacterium]